MLEYDALFAAERVRAPGLGALLEAALGSGGTRPGLAVGAAPVLRNVALGECGGVRVLLRALVCPSGLRAGLAPALGSLGWRGHSRAVISPQSGRWTPVLSSSPAGPASPAWPGQTGTPPARPSATATTARTTASAHTPGTGGRSASECWGWKGPGRAPTPGLGVPVADAPPCCRCPVGSDFWFMGLRCDYRVTQQSLLGMALGVLFSIVLLGAVIAGLVIRRFKALLLEARADQTRSRWGPRGDGVGMGGAEWWWGLCACPQHRQSSSFGSAVVGWWLCWPCCPSHGCVVPLWGLALWKGPRDRGQREQDWGLGSCPAGCSHNLGGDTRSVPAVGSAGSCGGTAGPGAAVTAQPHPAATGASAGWTTSRPSTGRAPGWRRPAPWTTRPSPTRRSCCTCRSWTTAAAAAARPRPLAAAPSSAPRPPPAPRTGPGSAWHRRARLLGIYQQGCGQPRSIPLPPGGNNCGWVVVFCLPSTGSFVFRVWWSCCRAHSCSKKRVAAGVCVRADNNT